MTKIFHSKSFQIIRLRFEIYTKKAKIGQRSAFLTTKIMLNMGQNQELNTSMTIIHN